MKIVSVLKSKLIVPELSKSFILTERLRRMHQRMGSCRAAILSAPAGYGKTSVVVSYLKSIQDEPSRICWYRLDPEDRNLAVFISHLTEAVFPSDSQEFEESRRMVLEESDIELQPFQSFSMICHELWSHESRLNNKRTYIVLDDFQNVAQVQDICDMTRFMLDNLPSSCTLFVLSRFTSHVFTEKQKLEKEILEIAAEDLSFMSEEIEALLLSMGQSTPDKKMSDMITKHTEGWIAGIIMLCQAIKSKGTDMASIDQRLLGHDEALFRYLSHEVLKSIDVSTQYALPRLALLQDFSEAEASYILEIKGIEAVIGECLGFGTFIQRIPGDPVTYRFHSLFREFLLSVLNGCYPKDQIAEFHLKAAEWYIKETTYTRAAEHLAKCGHSARVMDMVTKVGFKKFLIGQTGQLKMWIDLLPQEIIRDNPVLTMYQAQLMPNSRQLEMIEPLQRILKQALKDNSPDTYFNAASVLIYIFMCSNDMPGLIQMGAEGSWKSEELPENLNNTMAILDLVRFIGEERYSMAENISESMMYDLLPEDSQWLYLILSCILYYCLGKLDHAERLMKTALLLENYKSIEPAKGFILLFLATVLILKNEKDSVHTYVSEVLAIGEKYNYEYLSANGRRLFAFERYASFDVKGSLEMLDYAVYYYRKMNNRIMAEACRLLRYLWNTHPIQLEDLDEAKRAIKVIEKSRPGMMVYEYSLSILGAIAREAGDFNYAEECLHSSIGASKSKKCFQVLCGSYFHIARLYFAKGEKHKGEEYLKQAMELAASHKYSLFWDMHLPTLVEMVLRGLRYGYCPGYAEELLGKLFHSKTVKYLSAKVKMMDESRITSFTDHFVTSHKRDKSQQHDYIKASLLGTPEITLNGSIVPDSEWKTKKVKGMFEYLLLNSGKTVSKEVLADIFWPDSDSSSAIASQRTALYYLRKILSQHNVEISGNNAFIHENMEGLKIENNEVLELDIHEFQRLFKEVSCLDRLDVRNEQKELAVLEKLVTLYKGDLMDGSDHGDLVYQERERFKSLFIEVCQRLSLHYLRYGEFRQAEEILGRALAADPYNENLCLELITVYISQGRKSKAIKLFSTFKKRLEEELDIPVDRRLVEAVYLHH